MGVIQELSLRALYQKKHPHHDRETSLYMVKVFCYAVILRSPALCTTNSSIFITAELEYSWWRKGWDSNPRTPCDA